MAIHPHTMSMPIEPSKPSLIQRLWVALVWSFWMNRTLISWSRQKIQRKKKFGWWNFFAPWCGHCQQFASIYEKIAHELKDQKVAKVDCTMSKGLCSRFGITRYPSIKLIRILLDVGWVIEMDGERTLEAVTSFVLSDWQSSSKLPFPKPGETLMTSSFTDFLFTNPVLVWVLGLLLVLALFGFVYIILQTLEDDETSSRQQKTRVAQPSSLSSSSSLSSLSSSFPATPSPTPSPPPSPTPSPTPSPMPSPSPAAQSPKKKKKKKKQ